MTSSEVHLQPHWSNTDTVDFLLAAGQVHKLTVYEAPLRLPDDCYRDDFNRVFQRPIVPRFNHARILQIELKEGTVCRSSDQRWIGP